MLRLLSRLRNQRPEAPTGAVSSVLLALEQKAGPGARGRAVGAPF